MKTMIKEIKVYEFKELDQNIQEKLIEQEKKNMADTYVEWELYNDMTYFAEELLKNHNNNKFIQVRNYGHYTHENSFKINNYDLTDKQEQTLKAKIYKMNCELKNYGYSQIEHWWEADKEAIENLKEYEFYENGEIYW